MITMKNFGLDENLIDHSIWPKVIQVVVLSIIITPIALQTSFYAFRHASVLGVLALTYAALVVICEAPDYIKEFWNNEDFEWFVWDLNLFTGYSTAIFSYTYTTVALPIKAELINPAEYRIMKIFSRSVLMEMFIYLAIGVMGYLSMLKKTPDIILDRVPLNGSSDIYTLIARVTLIINLSISIPININPGRSHFMTLLNNKNTNSSRLPHYLITFFFLYGSAALSVVFPDILAAFSFLGGFCSVAIGIALPSNLFYVYHKLKFIQY